MQTICYVIAAIFISIIVLATTVYHCIKWGVVAWYKGKEFVLNHRKLDTRTFKDNHNHSKE